MRDQAGFSDPFELHAKLMFTAYSPLLAHRLPKIVNLTFAFSRIETPNGFKNLEVNKVS